MRQILEFEPQYDGTVIHRDINGDAITPPFPNDEACLGYIAVRAETDEQPAFREKLVLEFHECIDQIAEKIFGERTHHA
jgi:hypothetical protein